MDMETLGHVSDLRTQALCMCTHFRFLETMKGKFSVLKLRFGMNPTSSRSHSKPPFFQYKKPYMVPFQNTQKIIRENTKFMRNCESKREFVTKHPEVNIFLIEAFFWP